ncbi:agmatinase [Streptomyces sp. AgN23]|uniref:agmatinase n=1 Tax=Streptomyces sp. AgN23 TaxID=1188315 RepID=UPI001B34294B|nr:agmatinase [Streptomyces sp. AgN23]QTI88203.1 agmatinase [Streptomyces sp. AgN23]
MAEDQSATETRTIVGPPDALLAMPRYAGVSTFARLPRLDEVGRADVAVFGVPFDSGTTYRPGARFGPEAVRAGSKLLRPFHIGLEVEPWETLQVADAGDVGVTPFDIGEAIGQIEQAARGLYASADRIVTLGGDHTIALPMLRAAHAQHGPVALVHFDAHLDTWDNIFGARVVHGTPFRRAVEEGLLDVHHSAHIGIRSTMPSAQDFIDDKELGFATITTLEIARRGIDDVVDRVRSRVGDRPVYVSIDIDVLDPANAPGTGTPEPGGLTTRELQMILFGLADLDVIGADVVEIAPAYDHAQITALAAAGLTFDLLAMMARPATPWAG